jgi:hypothetical protein
VAAPFVHQAHSSYQSTSRVRNPLLSIPMTSQNAEAGYPLEPVPGLILEIIRVFDL